MCTNLNTTIKYEPTTLTAARIAAEASRERALESQRRLVARWQNLQLYLRSELESVDRNLTKAIIELAEMNGVEVPE